MHRVVAKVFVPLAGGRGWDGKSLLRGSLHPASPLLAGLSQAEVPLRALGWGAVLAAGMSEEESCAEGPWAEATRVLLQRAAAVVRAAGEAAGRGVAGAEAAAVARALAGLLGEVSRIAAGLALYRASPGVLQATGMQILQWVAALGPAGVADTAQQVTKHAPQRMSARDGCRELWMDYAGIL